MPRVRLYHPSVPRLPHIGISLGDPGGIGPEVIAKALADPLLRAAARFTIYGCRAPLARAIARGGLPLDPASLAVIELSTADAAPPAAPTAAGGDLSFRAVEAAIAHALLPPSDPLHIDALATAPISKEAWSIAGHGRYPGHTELLAERCGASRAAMLLYAPHSGDSLAPRRIGFPDGPHTTSALTVILATVHIPLRGVPAALTEQRVFDAIDLGHHALRRLGIPAPRIAVCGLNPHAGEGGLLGDEEAQTIAPAIARAVAAGLDARGPFPADTIFAQALQTPATPHAPARPALFDLVVAMYHDQGLIPVKLLARDQTVNVTVGLPIIRTSPDHGTAFDIAGTNAADPGSMVAAMGLAIRLARSEPATQAR